jgi:hypothetical protein
MATMWAPSPARPGGSAAQPRAAPVTTAMRQLPVICGSTASAKSESCCAALAGQVGEEWIIAVKQ